MDGNVHTFKARLVAKGFTQTHGIDYDETFSPVAMLKSTRILMAILAYYNYEIWQMDVKTAFLNGKLTEDVYMLQPDEFMDPKNPNKVCKLLKSIYGLKQASRSWNLHFDDEFEPCVYTKLSGSIVTFLVLYVDDILLIGNDVPTLQGVKAWLGKCFQMKDLGEAAYILGIKIYRNRSRRLIGLSQSTYIDKILKRFRMDESKKGFIPMQHGIVLSNVQCPRSSQDQDKMKSIPYASAIGSIMYAMLCTRPDVAYLNPGEAHWVAVKNILKYLRRTKEMFLVFGGSEDEISVTGYTNASFQTDRDDFRSQSGYVFTLNGGAISWKNSKQDTIADSTTEAEYIAESDATKEVVWLKNFISDLRVVTRNIYSDNFGDVAQAKEPRKHHKSRHVLMKYHLIREIIGRGDVRICKILTDENIADPLTKPLARVKHEVHASYIGMQYLDTKNSEISQENSKLGLWYQRHSDFDLIAYTDSDYGGCQIDLKSTSGNCPVLGGKLVSWSSKKQNCVSNSTTEAEYVAAASCALWIQTQLRDYGYSLNKNPILCDSKSAIAISANPVQHSKTKHIDIRYHFVKHHVEEGNVELYFVTSEYQLADLFIEMVIFPDPVENPVHPTRTGPGIPRKNGSRGRGRGNPVWSKRGLGRGRVRGPPTRPDPIRFPIQNQSANN
ncbi:LOW QUALITY PROTEIN: hypothetical protein OSB04_003238 [Centaurea solstitialis]|uniref:Reverse transcriptase Ty1/copia-type domain-containing protein n=1 Tax=Centaurea solstitialis TaxID=347529 RepID=A0AA38WN11_9ASTR|nr:LOW QUALITY PROTEIN: hypothetical protein OSB04_003238 [Centaurea solstitialis]